MYKLYYSPGACSMAAHIILEELGIAYEAEKVDLKSHTVDGKDFRAINPQGMVPTLVLEDGSLLTQNIAILSYLGDLDKQHQLLPECGTMARVRAVEWLGFITSDLHKSFGPLFKTGSYVNSEVAKTELKQNVENSIKKTLALADEKLKPQGYALGENFSVVDAYLFVIYQWANFLHIPVNSLTNFVALGQRVAQRPAVQRMLKKEEMLR